MFFNGIEWGFMGVPKNGKEGAARQMVNCVITPFSAGNTSAVSCKDLPKLGAIKEQRFMKPSGSGYPSHLVFHYLTFIGGCFYYSKLC